MDEITKEYRSRMKKKLAWMEYTLPRIKEIEDQKQGGYSGYFKQFPNVFAEGDTEHELITNLFNALHDIFDYEASKVANDLKSNDSKVTKKSIFLQSA
ncbi:MAG: hypothetical protein MI921_02825 [Cytophagales bacterium]|nr:hypothetical protein [Cytophagales bacterium]